MVINKDIYLKQKHKTYFLIKYCCNQNTIGFKNINANSS